MYWRTFPFDTKYTHRYFLHKETVLNTSNHSSMYSHVQQISKDVNCATGYSPFTSGFVHANPSVFGPSRYAPLEDLLRCLHLDASSLFLYTMFLIPYQLIDDRVLCLHSNGFDNIKT